MDMPPFMLWQFLRNYCPAGHFGGCIKGQTVVAKQASEQDIILDLKDPNGNFGYVSQVGERWVKLSVGEH
ncbi:MAG: hypothetical protein P8M25_00805 [Paracoccaceae bacterium]|nr:hypothetical protein [Paracoccaceae bacterium]